MTHSSRCTDPKTFWDRSRSVCVLCAVKPGYEVTTNCGLDDTGGRHEPHFKECKAGVAFNDGSGAFCQPCASCPAGFNMSSPCTTTTDTKCQELPGSGSTRGPVAKPQDLPFSITEAPSIQGPIPRNATTVLDQHHDGGIWALVIIGSIMLLVICACIIYVKRKKVQRTVMGFRRGSSHINAGFSSLSAPDNEDLELILSSDILSAPLQTVLDNLDVLEELVILLDPESQGVKNTKHLASHCSFPATWITYTYSMKDIKSPLKAVLEGVTSRNPDWTVGHLVKLLRHMERNDAIAVLATLRLNVMQV